MRKRRFYPLLIGVLALIGVLVAVVSGPREPEYKGRKLSEWVEKTVSYMPPSPPSGVWTNVFPNTLVPLWVVPNDAQEGIRHLGSNTVPYLVGWIGYEPSEWKAKLFMFINRTLHSTFIDHQRLRADGAARALAALGPEAAGAVPDLAILMNNARAPNTARRAASALSHLQSVLFPAALALMTNDSSMVRLQSFSMATLWGKTNRVIAVPGLVRFLRDTDAQKAEDAAVGLGVLGAGGTIAVPALTESLRDERPRVRKAAIEALGEFGGEARAAMPALSDLLKDPDTTIRTSAAKALRKIDGVPNVADLLDSLEDPIGSPKARDRPAGKNAE